MQPCWLPKVRTSPSSFPGTCRSWPVAMCQTMVAKWWTAAPASPAVDLRPGSRLPDTPLPLSAQSVLSAAAPDPTAALVLTAVRLQLTFSSCKTPVSCHADEQKFWLFRQEPGRSPSHMWVRSNPHMQWFAQLTAETSRVLCHVYEPIGPLLAEKTTYPKKCHGITTGKEHARQTSCDKE